MGLRTGRLRRIFEVSTRSEVEAAELRADTRATGSILIQQCGRGEPVRACGVLRSVIIRPRSGSPTLEAELYDGTGRLTLVWLGRRRIQGIEAGRALVVSGRLTCEDDQKLLYNPKYELRPRGDT